MSDAYTHELDVVRRAARDAAKAVMEVHDAVGRGDSELGVVQKADDRGPVTEADRRANRVVVAALREAFPEDAILSEESADDMGRLTADRYWCIDPLDGTKEFIRRNGEFAVMVALVERASGRPVVGAVAEPATGRLTWATLGGGTWTEDAPGADPRRLRVTDHGTPDTIQIIVSRSHPDDELKSFMAHLGTERVTPCGSVGVKIGRIAQEKADLYVNFGGRTCFWDTCAPELLLSEAGGRFTNIDGELLDYRLEDTTNHAVLIASNGACHELALEAARAAVKAHRGQAQ
ncbi:MAG: 3'(2'),5'-bisphosphate nucleotidase CysQ [Myxococcales bacterium]|nr:3'(2'),5'-bisphosphate nucleotidase CysQ [Myxococcales bacterium]